MPSMLKNPRLLQILESVTRHLDHEELRIKTPGARTLSAHSLRVAKTAARLARETRLVIPDYNLPEAAFLAGLMHDLGKFIGGRYHCDNIPEEIHASRYALELLNNVDYPLADAERIACSIQQLYTGEPEPHILTALVQDADALDKLGYRGIANFFIKSGLRGSALDLKRLLRLSVELTHLRCAPECMRTLPGRELATRRAEISRTYFLALLDEIRNDGLYPCSVRELSHRRFPVVAIVPDPCECGGDVDLRVTMNTGNRSTEIQLLYRCSHCGWSEMVTFCQPKMQALLNTYRTA